MTLKEFTSSLEKEIPPEGINELLTALWYAAKDDWEKSHEIVQSLNGKDAAWIHAYLHRVEGDIGNASYWYSTAGRNVPPGTLEEEWEDIVKELISQC